MPQIWITTDYARNALLPYADMQVPAGDFEQAIPKAQGWVTAFISPAIAKKATDLDSIPEYAPLALCVAMYAAFFVVRKLFMQRTPNQNNWVKDLRNDADKILEQIKLNPQKAFAGTDISSDAVGQMGLNSSKENIVPTGTLLGETSTFIDPRELTIEAEERGLPSSYPPFGPP